MAGPAEDHCAGVGSAVCACGNHRWLMADGCRDAACFDERVRFKPDLPFCWQGRGIEPGGEGDRGAANPNSGSADGPNEFTNPSPGLDPGSHAAAAAALNR